MPSAQVAACAGADMRSAAVATRLSRNIRYLSPLPAPVRRSGAEPRDGQTWERFVTIPPGPAPVKLCGRRGPPRSGKLSRRSPTGSHTDLSFVTGASGRGLRLQPDRSRAKVGRAE